MANDWINTELEQKNQEMMDKLRSENKLADAARVARNYWEELQNILFEDVKTLNDNTEIQKLIGGKIECFREGYSSYKISKTIFPAIYLIVSLDDLRIKIEKTTVEIVDPKRFGSQGGKTRSRSETEQLRVSIDENDHFHFKTEAEEVLPFVKLSEYLLKPLLIPHTVVRNYPFGGHSDFV